MAEIVSAPVRPGRHRRVGSIMAIEAERPLDTRQMFVENYLERSSIVEWTTPKFEEVCLNCEINSYASAAM